MQCQKTNAILNEIWARKKREMQWNLHLNHTEFKLHISIGTQEFQIEFCRSYRDIDGIQGSDSYKGYADLVHIPIQWNRETRIILAPIFNGSAWWFALIAFLKLSLNINNTNYINHRTIALSLHKLCELTK